MDNKPVQKKLYINENMIVDCNKMSDYGSINLDEIGFEQKINVIIYLFEYLEIKTLNNECIYTFINSIMQSYLNMIEKNKELIEKNKKLTELKIDFEIQNLEKEEKLKAIKCFMKIILDI